MKYLKKFFEINEYSWLELSEEEKSFIDDIKYIIIEAEDFGYQTSYWLNGYFEYKDNDKPLSKLEIEFNKDHKVPKEDYKSIIHILERLEDYLTQTDFEIKWIQLFDYSKVTTNQEQFFSVESIDTNLDNINTYFTVIKRK